ncbi:MAG: Asp-tRNA(Asn)/Glu-tRNA(Gln) amidotransferase subunit GatA [Microscillaceae bacterium]|jgi:aspartyl-tRNA(Asn)/glutamyl-tRNA(Gln) amidotransferase subunit A|nr:Asp-tRNA(Asn)/Glu-tRNA(Gln) amidotransferase subunit GatA [Microscillaceae bacterium]
MYSAFRDIRQALFENRLTCVDLVKYYLQNIENQADLNVFLSVYAEEALAQAHLIDQKIQNQTAGRLAGMVIGLKDVICYQNHPLQGGSKILNGFVSQFSATVVERLLAEDAIIIGRQNCDEFAMGSSNENSAFGVVRNAADKNRVPGGSSGGSAVAVQANMCLASLGSDTGGSVRQPAAFCGLVGLKPTYSRISRYGLVAYASSFDCIGIITQNVEDNALLLEIIAGGDAFDSTVSFRAVPKYSQSLNFSQKPKIAYLREAVESAGLSEAVRVHTRQKLDFLRQAGYVVEAVDFPLIKYILPTYYILTTAEASSNLARFDGVRYGYRSPQAQDLRNMYVRSRQEGFGAEVQRRIMLGTFVLSADYYDAYYTKAQKVRRLIQEATNEIFKKYDFLVMPTTPRTAFEIGALTGDPIQMYLEDLFTVQANLVGKPAISIPNGVDEKGLPIGFQIMADSFQEADLLAFANYLAQ